MPPKKSSSKEKIIIGRTDKADFPELGLENIDIKIDTGAYTSSIHCQDIRIVEKMGEERVKFSLLDPKHPSYNKKKYYLPVHSYRKIKNSFGQTEERIIIKTELILFGKNFSVELSLSDRSEMKYPVLIGRKLLQRKFVVDVDKYDLSYKQKISAKNT